MNIKMLKQLLLKKESEWTQLDTQFLGSFDEQEICVLTDKGVVTNISAQLHEAFGLIFKEKKVRDLVDIALSKEISEIDLSPLVQVLTEMRAKDYWLSKNKRLAYLDNNEFIAYYVAYHTLGFSNTIQELVAKLSFLTQGLSIEDSIRNASDCIEACNGLIYTIEKDPVTVVSHYRLEPETYNLIQRFNEYRPPLVTKPRDWKSNVGGGYYLDEDHCILGSKFNRHSEPQALDVLNKLQSVALELDPVVLGLEEMPNKELTSPDSKKQFFEMKRNSKKLYKEYQGKEFYFQHRFDFRGRMYSSGYLINIQGSSYKKALINFAKKELIL